MADAREELFRQTKEQLDLKNYRNALSLYEQADSRGWANELPNELKTAIGIAYFETQSYENAVEIWKNNENPKAITLLGVCYFQGKGVEQDKEKAKELLLKAASQGEALAEFNLAVFYYHENQFEEEFKWCLSAAEKGHHEAIHRIATMFEEGRGTVDSVEKHLYWAKRSALLGNVEMQNHLGKVYDRGMFGFVDSNEANKWYRMAADQGDVTAMNNLGVLYYYSNHYESALFWFLKAGDFPDAALNAASIYENGLSTERNLKKAFELYSLCLKNPEAIAGLARIHATADSFCFNPKMAVELFKEAITKGSVSAFADLKRLEDDEQSMKKAAENGDVRAMEEWGIYLKKKQDYSEAFHFLLAASKRSPTAKEKLIEMGREVERQLLGSMM